MMRARWAIAAWLALVAAGCARTAPAPGGNWRVLAGESVLFHIVWQADLSTDNAFSMRDSERGGVAAADGLVAVGTSERGLVGLSAADGTIRWENREPLEAYAAPPTLVGGLALVPGPDGTLRGLDAGSGVERWSRDLGAPLHARVTTRDGRGCIANAFGTGRVFDLASGAIEFEFEHQVGGQMSVLGDGACTFDGDRVYIGFADGTLGAFEDGRAAWLVDLARGAGRFVDVDTTPVRWNDLIIAASFHGGITALDRASGATVWHRDLTGATSPVLVDGALVTTTADAGVVWLDPATGDVRNELGLDAAVLGAALHVADVLVIPSPRGLFVVDAHAPWVYHRFDPGSGFSTTPATDGQRVYALSDNGFVYALELRAY